MLAKDLLLRNVRNRPDKEAIYCEPCDLRLTYREFDRRVNSLCNMLLQNGVKKGDRIAITASNCHIQPEIIMTAAKGGWALVEIDYRLSSDEMEYIISDTEPRVLFVGRDLEDVTAPLFSKFPDLEKVSFPEDYNRVIATYSDQDPEIEFEEEEIITILYTSGTTGMPKGVIYTHKNLMASVVTRACTLYTCENDRTLHTSPFTHVAATWPFLLHCYHGGSNVIITNPDGVHILEIIEKERITTWNSVPALLIRILDVKDKERFDISSLRWITYGAAPIAMPVLRKALDYFGPIMNHVYGCTETYLLSCLKAEDFKLDGTETEKEIRRMLASCGKEAINTETRVVNEDGVPVKPGEVGEIITRGDHVTPGYWRKEEETRKSIKNGWFYTGDLATVDEEGYLYIVGRKKDIIITGGENVAPKEVENVLYKHEAVKEVAVVGLPHKKWGEAIAGFVILKDGAEVAENDLIAFSRERLAGYKTPKTIVFVEDFPRTPSGKILTRRLRDLHVDYFVKEV